MLDAILRVAAVVHISHGFVSLERERESPFHMRSSLWRGRTLSCTRGAVMGQMKEAGVHRALSQGGGARGFHTRRAGNLSKPLLKMLAVQLLSGDATSCLNSVSFQGLFNISNKNKINNGSVYGNLRQK